MSCMLRLSTYDDAVSVNMSAHGDGIRRALASVGVITQHAPAPLAAHHNNDHSATDHPTLPDHDGRR